jgi:probable rRNA maturation factor
MRIYVNNLYQYYKEIKETAEQVINGENLSGDLSITFVDDDVMSELNEKYTGRNGTTDVLSFSFNIPELLGDIYISVEQADRQKENDILYELKLLTIHGILHLAGYNDKEEIERNKMRKKEKEYLS